MAASALIDVPGVGDVIAIADPHSAAVPFVLGGVRSLPVRTRVATLTSSPRLYGGSTCLVETAAPRPDTRWWNTIGCHRYPNTDRLLICADGGGSNGYRVRAWKVELARLAAETGLTITVCHLPPGTSKWNKIEHRLVRTDG